MDDRCIRLKIFLPLAITLMFLCKIDIVLADLTNATGKEFGDASASACSGYPCYASNTHIGIRFSLVNKNTGQPFSRIDVLTPDLANQLNSYSEPILVMNDNIYKADLLFSRDNDRAIWEDYLPYENMFSVVLPDAITGSYNSSLPTSQLSQYMENFNSIIVAKGSQSGTIFYETLLGNDKLVNNYNSNTEDYGDVFSNGNDKIVLDYILAALWGKPYGDDNGADVEANIDTYIRQMVEGGYVLQIEPTTVIDFKAQTRRFFIYGTAADIRAISGYVLYEDTGGNSGLSGNPGIRTGDSIFSLYSGTDNSALKELNAGLYSLMDIGGYYHGSAGYCRNVDWNKIEYYSCGIGIIDISLLSDNPKCKIEQEGDEIYYYGAGGEILNAAALSDPWDEVFIEQCICDSGSDTYRNYGFGSSSDEVFSNPTLNTADGFFSGSESDARKNYITTNCNPPEDREDPKVCNPKVVDQNCDTNDNSVSFVVGDINDEGEFNDCVFSQANINTTVSDSTTGGSTYTKRYNQYCSLTCAEKIEFEMPGEVAAIDAGKYWTWDQPDISITGTRKCQATVDVAQYRKDLTDEGNITDLFENGEATGDIEAYGLLEELDDLRDLYQEYQDLSDDMNIGYIEDPAETHSHTSCSNGICNTSYTYCDAFEYTTSAGQTFERYEGDCRNSSHSNYNWEDVSTGESINDSLEEIKDLYEPIIEEIKNRTEDVNECTDGLADESSSDSLINQTYDFDPNVTLRYKDGQYGEPYTYTAVEVSTSTEPEVNVADKETIEYYSNIDGNDKDSLDYNTGSSNSIIWTKTKEYNSNKYFYTLYSNNQKGIANYTSESGFYALTNAYKYGNNLYPISLNETAGRYWYVLNFKNLGVDQRSGNTSNRFDKLVIDTNESYNQSNSLDYVCYYNVKEDVLKDQKPDFFYRNVSLNNFDPNNRDENSDMMNWDTDNPKAAATLAEIEDNKDNVYNEEPEYSFTLTPDNMQEIRKYNHEREDSGGYSDFNMTGVSVESVDYANTLKHDSDNTVWYLSDFITSGESNGYFTMNRSDRTFTAFEDWEDLVEQNMGPAWK